jgi:hypothetical protein
MRLILLTIQRSKAFQDFTLCKNDNLRGGSRQITTAVKGKGNKSDPGGYMRFNKTLPVPGGLINQPQFTLYN